MVVGDISAEAALLVAAPERDELGGGREQEIEESEAEALDKEGEEEGQSAGRRRGGCMWMSEEEISLAKELKAAVEQDPYVDALPDYWYAQFAIFALNHSEQEPPNLACLVQQVTQLQHVREEHRILDNLSNGSQMVERMIKDLLPGYILNYGYDAEEDAYAVVVDIARFDMSIFSDSEKVSTWIAAVFYMQCACTKDLETIRKGLHFLVECEGYELRGNKTFNVNAHRKWTELGAAYPMNFASFRHFHTGMFVNLLVSAGRKLLPSYIHQRFEVGCKFDCRLDKVFLVPTVEAANDRIVANLKEALRQRYNNMSSFSLDDNEA